MHQILSPIGPLLPIMQVKAEYVLEIGYYFLNINHTLTIQSNYDFFFQISKGNKNWFRKSGSLEIGGKITVFG